MKINKTPEQQEMELRKNGFKKVEAEDQQGWFPPGTYTATKDKKLVYYGNPTESFWGVGIEHEGDSIELAEFHTLDQFLSSFKKGKLVF